MTSSSFVAGEKKAATATRRDLVFPGEEKLLKLAFCCEPEIIQNTFDVNETGLQRPRMPDFLTQNLIFFGLLLTASEAWKFTLDVSSWRVEALFGSHHGPNWSVCTRNTMSSHFFSWDHRFIIRILRIFDSSTVSVVDFRAYIYFLLHLV